jgi:dihydrofolate synthase/folylpolyglutamate synthase
VYRRINYERQTKVPADGFRLQNMQTLLQRLGNPQAEYPVIHVAGTKGKGSVSTMVGSMLTASGYRTAVYTSPHLETIHQRMAIDGRLVTDAQLLDVLMRVLSVVTGMDQEAAETGDATVTFFEITTAAAMLFFAQQQVDYAVLEVGLGGRLDSTNVCQPAVCVITNISLDHTKQLGKTIDKIAREKAGIIKPTVPVVSGAKQSDAADVIAAVAADQRSPLFLLDGDFRATATPSAASPGQQTFRFEGTLAGRAISVPDVQLSLLGEHQRTNAALAVAAVHLLDDPKDQITADSVRRGLARATLPGRAEITSRSPLVILDIAHNAASAAALAETLNAEVPAWRSAKRRTILFATSRDKDAAAMLAALTPHCDCLWLTEYQTNPRALDLETLLAQFAGLQESPSQTVLQTSPTPAAAWQEISAGLGADEAVCITGSAFLIAETRPLVSG